MTTRHAYLLAPLLLVPALGLLLTGCGSGGVDPGVPAEDPVLYAADDGPHTLAEEPRLDLVDASRDKVLAIRLAWPAEGGPFPLILFSHGYRGSRNTYAPLVERWVSRGYVCIRFDHTDSFEIPAADRADFEDWASRPADLSFVLDSLDAIEAAVPAIAGKIDRSRIGVGGHSFGAGTSNLIGGATTVLGQSFHDPRVSGVLLVSPQGEGDLLGPSSWDAFALPMLVITGTLDDSSRTGNDWTWRLDPYTHAPPGDRYLAILDGAYHDFGGISGVTWPGQGPPNEDHVQYVRSASTAFFDAYVKGEEAAAAYLLSDEIERASGGIVDWDHR